MSKNQQSKSNSKSIINFLKSAPEPPKDYLPLINLNARRDRMAHHLGITSSYLYNILSGSKTPSKSLHHKIMELISDIKAESDYSIMDIVSGDGVAGGDAHLMQEGGLE